MLEQNSRKIQSGALLVIASLISPILGLILSLICISRDTDEWQPCVFSISLFMAVIAYVYDPIGDPDLVRYFQMINSVRGYNFSSIMTASYSFDIPMYTFNFLRWICVITEDDHLMPAISVFFIYFINLYIVTYFGKKTEQNKSYIFWLLIVLAFFSWKSVANNVRNVFAFSIVTYGTFREIELRKNPVLSYFLYMVAVFLHPTAIILVAFRVALFFSNKIRYVIIIVAVLTQPLIVIIYQLFYQSIGSALIKRLLYMGYMYFTDTSSSWGLIVQASRTQALGKYLTMVLCIILVAIYIRNVREEKKMHQSVTDFNNYSFYLTVTTIACFPIITPAYWRFSYGAVATGCCNYYELSSETNNSIFRIIANTIIVFCSIGLLLLHLWTDRNDLIHILKSFDWFLTSPAIIIGRDIFRAIL